MPFPRPLVALAALSIFTACADSGPTDQPSFIVNGEPTGSAYGSVGALVFDWWEPIGVINGDDQWCTGTLISPTVFLTAAHCVVGPDTPAGTQFYVSFAPTCSLKG